MLKLDRMTDYALVRLRALACRLEEVLAAAQLSVSIGLKRSAVSKVVKTLVAADVLADQRKAHGGYRLSREAAIVLLVQIFEVMKGYIADNEYDGGAVSRK